MNKKIAAVIIVAIIIIAAVAAVFYYEDSKSNETSPLTGEWKLADEHGVDSEGNFMSHNETAETAVISISSVKDDLFYGKYLNEEIAGAYIDGHVFFQATVDREKVNFEGHLNDGVLSLTYAHGTDKNTCIHYSIFTSNGKYEDKNKYADLKDLDLSISSGYICSISGAEEFIGDMKQGIKITSHEEGAFIGVMDQVVGDDNVPLEIRGIIYPDTNTLCRFIDENGHVWEMSLKDNVAIVNNIMISDVGINEDELSAIERIYVKNNSSISASLNLDKLAGDWYAASTHTLSADGKTSEETVFHSLSFINIYNSIAAGTSSHNGENGSIVAYHFTDPDTGNQMIKVVSQYGDELITGYGWLSSDGNVFNLIEIHTDDKGKQTAEHSTFSKNTNNDKILGDWKVAYAKGSSQGTELKEYSRAGTPHLSTYDLTIDKSQLSLISGTYRDMDITGTLLGNLITIEIRDEGSSELLKGFLLETDVLVLYSTAFKTVENVDSIATWCMVYTRSGGPVDYSMTYDEVPVLENKWLLANGESYNGTSHNLSGSSFEIIMQDGNWISCKMEQTVGSEVVNKTVIGFIFDAGGLTAGTMIDENGNYWYINVSDSALLMHSAMQSELAEIKGQPVAVERVYTLDGKAVELPQTPSLENTSWDTATMYSILNNGKIIVADGDFEMKIESQKGSLLAGTENVGDVPSKFAACMFENGYGITIEKLQDSAGVFAHGSVYDKMMIFTCTISFGDFSMTSILYLEEEI